MSELTQHSTRALAIVTVAIAVWGCSPQLPVGRFACTTDSDCPEGWSCGLNANGAQRCFPEGSDYRAIRTKDGSVHDSETPDAGESPESGTPAIDASGGAAGNPPTGMTSNPPVAGSGTGTAGKPAAGSGGGEAGSSAAGTGGPAAGAGGSAMPPGNQPNCTPDEADPANGVFVSPSGSASATCGAAAEPCATLEQAMDRATAMGRSVIYLDRGTYSEALALRAGLTFRGGYARSDASWTRSCATDRASYSRIQSTTEVGVWAEYAGSAELESLTVATLATVPMGHSTYGVFARGTSTKLTLREVEVFAASGGDGQTGNSGATPAPRTGTCAPAGDGANGVGDGLPGTGAAAGTIDSSGYVPGDGAPGGPGEPGHNGTAGQSTCRVCYESCDTTTCSGTTTGQSCGVPGSAGCGGAAAEGGGGGGGGGSSFGLFAWGAQVQVIGGLLQSGNGGRGGAGGNPGNGGEGSDGSAGMNGESCTVCTKGIGPITPPPLTPDTEVQAAEIIAGPNVAPPIRVIDGGVISPVCVEGKGAGVGTAGGRGGKGSRGGVGGGGAGGSSYGVWAGGQAQLDVSASTRIEIGEAGRSQSTGAKGESMVTKFSN